MVTFLCSECIVSSLPPSFSSSRLHSYPQLIKTNKLVPEFKVNRSNSLTLEEGRAKIAADIDTVAASTSPKDTATQYTALPCYALVVSSTVNFRSDVQHEEIIDISGVLQWAKDDENITADSSSSIL